MASKTILYIITQQSVTEKSGWFKIGVTNDADRRLREHQTGNPNELSYRKLYTFPNSTMADLVEKALLVKLPSKDYVLEYRSEWFKVDDVTKLEDTVGQAVEKLKELLKDFNHFVKTSL